MTCVSHQACKLKLPSSVRGCRLLWGHQAATWLSRRLGCCNLLAPHLASSSAEAQPTLQASSVVSSASVDLDDDVQKMAIERQLRQSKDPQPVYLPQHIRGSVERAAAERASEDEAAAAEAPAEEAAPAPGAQAASPAGKEALALRKSPVCGTVCTESGSAGSCSCW